MSKKPSFIDWDAVQKWRSYSKLQDKQSRKSDISFLLLVLWGLLDSFLHPEPPLSLLSMVVGLILLLWSLVETVRSVQSYKKWEETYDRQHQNNEDDGQL